MGGVGLKKKVQLHVTDIYTTKAQMHLAVGSQESGRRDFFSLFSIFFPLDEVNKDII